MADLQAVKDEFTINPASMPYLTFTPENAVANAEVINRRSRVRFRRKLAAITKLHEQGLISEIERQQRETALIAFATAANVKSWQFRTRTLERLSVSGYKARTE